MTTDLAEQLNAYLLRADGQEDLCFLTWRASVGATRTTAVLREVIWPEMGERLVHGNAAFTSAYFLRAAARAADTQTGLALIHSHPGGRRWQRLSAHDNAAEAGHAAQATVITGHPLVGLTYAGDGTLSARFWLRAGRRSHCPQWCENVRVVGDRIALSWNDQLRGPPSPPHAQVRTVSAWGSQVQSDLARLHVGIVGAGSVGQMVAESLARLGVSWFSLFDFDTVEIVNLDRLMHAIARDAALWRSKVHCLARGLRRSSTTAQPRIDALELSVVEPEGMARALDCDVLFSCVDRPWPRAALNLAAYAHLIPVVDGGILIRVGQDHRMRGAEWRAHMAAPGRRCLECLGQYDPADVALERTGLLDDPTYLAGLPPDSRYRRRENVFPYSMATSAAEVQQLLTAVVAPSGIGDVGAHLYHVSTGTLDRETRGCELGCPYSETLLAGGDGTALQVTSGHPAADLARSVRHRQQRRWGVRAGTWFDNLLHG